MLSEDVLGRSSEMDMERLFLERWLLEWNFKPFLMRSTSRPTSKTLRDIIGVSCAGKVRSNKAQESMESSTEYFFLREFMNEKGGLEADG